ncbi:MAG TPA: pepsin-like aspartic protease [Polyangiaceae bacterium]
MTHSGRHRARSLPILFALLASSACGGSTAGDTSTDGGPGSTSDGPVAESDAAPDVEDQPEASPGLLSVPLYSCDGTGYTVGTTIGGSQQFQLLLDTGSTTLGVAASTCTSCGVSPEYTPGATAVDQKNMAQSTYDLGSWSGEIYKDAVVLGAATSAEVDLVGIETQSMFFNPIECDSKSGGVQGVLGFGPKLAAVPGTNGYFDQLVGTGTVPDVFATELCNTGGTLWLGGYDPSHTTGAPQYVPLLTDSFSQLYYAVDLTSITVNGTTVPIASAQFEDSVVDTGTSIFLLGTTAFDALGAAIAKSSAFQSMVGGATFFADGCQQSTAFSATKASLDAALPALTLTFSSGATVQALPTESYLVAVASDVWCPALAQQAQSDQTFPFASVMGAAVLRSSVVVFDREKKRIGFAPHTACP